MNIHDLCAWLRENSSGIYRPARDAADMIEAQAAEIERLTMELAEAKRERDRICALRASVHRTSGRRTTSVDRP